MFSASNKQMGKKKSGAFLTTVRAKPKRLDELHSLYRGMHGNGMIPISSE